MLLFNTALSRLCMMAPRTLFPLALVTAMSASGCEKSAERKARDEIRAYAYNRADAFVKDGQKDVSCYQCDESYYVDIYENYGVPEPQRLARQFCKRILGYIDDAQYGPEFQHPTKLYLNSGRRSIPKDRQVCDEKGRPIRNRGQVSG